MNAIYMQQTNEVQDVAVHTDQGWKPGKMIENYIWKEIAPPIKIYLDASALNICFVSMRQTFASLLMF